MKKIKLSQGFYATVDDSDYEELSKHKWCAQRNKVNVYAFRIDKNSNPRSILMHRQIMGFPEKGFDVDHVDRNGLNNQRENLRVVTHSENLRNRRKSKNKSSQYLGVCLCKRTGRWMAYITIDGKLKGIGRYDTEREAAIVYDIYARHKVGGIITTNF